MAGEFSDFNNSEVRPWGNYKVLYHGVDCKVKRITVYPGKRLSYQYHFKRQEHWTVVSGRLTITIDGINKALYPGESIQIPLGTKHRAYNELGTNAVFIEVQTGTYFGEDDIVRIEDDYGRV